MQLSDGNHYDCVNSELILLFDLHLDMTRMNDIENISYLIYFDDILVFLEVLNPHRSCHPEHFPGLRLKLLHEFIFLHKYEEWY